MALDGKNKKDKPKITLSQLRLIWPNQSTITDTFLSEVAKELTNSLCKGKIDSELRISHFLAQVKQEVGYRFSLDEDLTYRESSLIAMFSYYRKNLN